MQIGLYRVASICLDPNTLTCLKYSDNAFKTITLVVDYYPGLFNKTTMMTMEQYAGSLHLQGCRGCAP
jgi:hypothetical protein